MEKFASILKAKRDAQGFMNYLPQGMNFTSGYHPLGHPTSQSIRVSWLMVAKVALETWRMQTAHRFHVSMHATKLIFVY